MNSERDDDRVAIDLDPQTALRALLKVDPDAEPIEDTEPALGDDAHSDVEDDPDSSSA